MFGLENLTLLVNELVKLPAETERVEFKHNKYTPTMIGEDVSALANGAALAGRPFAYLVWGVDDATHEVLGTENEWHAMHVGKQEIDNWVRTQLSGNTELDLLRTQIDEQRHVLILKIGSAVNRPVSFNKIDTYALAAIRRNSATYRLSRPRCGPDCAPAGLRTASPRTT